MLPKELTFAMTTDMEIHTLRQLGGRLNDTLVQVNLTYTALSSVKPYNISGRHANGEQINESYWTQDEAEQAYIFHAAQVAGAVIQMLAIHVEQASALQAKLNGERAPGPNYSCVPDDAYVDPIAQRDMQALLADAGM